MSCMFVIACFLCHHVYLPIFSCPLCEEVIVVKAGQDPNVVVDDHMSSPLCSQTPTQKAKTTHTIKHKCFKCGKHEMVKATCSGCSQDFCLKHRFGKDHDCKAQKPIGRSIGPFIVSYDNRVNNSVKVKS